MGTHWCIQHQEQDSEPYWHPRRPLGPKKLLVCCCEAQKSNAFAVDVAILSPQIIPEGTAGLLQTEVFTKRLLLVVGRMTVLQLLVSY